MAGTAVRKAKREAFLLPSFSKPADYIQSPFRYPGGKFYAMKYILPFIDAVPHDEYREPFVGGGTLFFGKQKVKHNWINDLERDLITTYKVIGDKSQFKKLKDMVSKETASKKRHAEIKEYEASNELNLAYKTYYLNRTSYCGIINKPAWGYKVGKSSPPENWGKFITAANQKLQDIKITSLDFEDVIKAKPLAKASRVMMYLDPPYFHADQKRAYTKSFELADHVRLQKVLLQTPYYFCLSYDDCREIRELYNWANIYEKSWLYNTANKSAEKRDLGNELIITNYDAIAH